jgi:serine/threonine-protein kinase
MLTTVVTLVSWYLVEGRFTSAPALSALSQAEARQVAERAGLRLQVDEAYDETVPPGTVISTDPGPGARVVDGGQIEAVVSRGPERYPMPAVVGLTRSAATAALDGGHLRTGRVTEAWSTTAPVGTVTQASTAPGTRLRPETVVDLTVSKGPRPIPVTDYTGRSAGTAAAALEKAGFTVVVERENSDSVAAGRVLSQTPRSGSGQAGDTVTLTRSLGPVLVTVPNVRAMGIRAAERVMADAGFKTTVRPAAVNYLGVGFVVSTDPGARAQAPKGSTITLYVV